VTEHPTSEELYALYRGELPPAKARAVTRHVVLEGCEHCLASLPAPLHAAFELSPPPVELTPEQDAGYDAAIQRALQATLKHMSRLTPREAMPRKAPVLLVGAGGELLGELPRHMRIADRVDTLLAQSWALRHENPTRMVELAEMAVRQSKNLDLRRHSLEEVHDLEGRALAELGNAYRVMGQLDLATITLDRARGFLAQGSRDELLTARLQELEASLAADRSQFGAASDLLLAVQALHERNGDPHQTGRILILRGLYTGYAGEPEKAIALLQDGLSRVDERRDPSLVYSGIHNQLLFLVDAGRYEEARRFRFENSRVLRDNGGRINEARFRGIEGRLDLGTGNYSRAEMTFREVASEMRELGLLFVSAVVSLDLGMALLIQGKSADAERVTLAASEVFRRLRVQREGLAALSMLQSAFQQGQATVQLMQDVTAFFRRLDVNPIAV
jgi:tetratricopeptide (TPR) repeat protein